MRALAVIGTFAALTLLFGQAYSGPPTYTEERVTGSSQGNHDLDCTVIRPWGRSGPNAAPYPVIAWANGWDQGNVVGQTTTLGYKPGLIEWALDGPYIVVAANQWSVQESDVLACLQWVIDNEEAADPYTLGLAGHSQGGGAVIKAGDGEPYGFKITSVVAMNPYGPSWVSPEIQDGPMLLLGGTKDTTTPTSSFEEVFTAMKEAGKDAVLAELMGGSHNSEAWGVDSEGNTLDVEEAQLLDFGEYQEITELWWQFQLNGNARDGKRLRTILDENPPWITDYSKESYLL